MTALMSQSKEKKSAPRRRRASTPTNSGEGTGVFVLENSHGEVVRSFQWESEKVFVVFRHDNRRIETFPSVEELDESGVSYELIAKTTPSELKKRPLRIQDIGQIRWVDSALRFSQIHELPLEEQLTNKQLFGWSFGIQGCLALLFLITAFIGASTPGKKDEHTVMLVPEDVIQKILNEKKEVVPPRQKEVVKPMARKAPPQPKRVAKKVVVAPAKKKIVKKSVPVRSAKKVSRGGGHRSAQPRGSGTNEPQMSQIGALGALTKGGNGGKGGLNLQAAGTEAGSGAGGKGRGGFGGSGNNGRGVGGLGQGKKSGLSNSMYGKGIIAAPMGDGGAAAGSGGYGTRGKAGGGERGAGYGKDTVVGSWKGTGPTGPGEGGSGLGEVDLDTDDMIVRGGLTADQIEAVINRNRGQIRYCYEQGLQRSPSLSGRVAVRFQIGANGRVASAGIAHSSVRSAQVENCIVGKLRTWKFPKPDGGVTVAVTYPFTLRRTSQR